MSGYWVCCNCDADLSCDKCGVEQPNDSAYYDAMEKERNQLRADNARLLEVIRPFVTIPDQSPANMAKVIHKGLDGMTPIALTVTKDQFMIAWLAVFHDNCQGDI